MKVSLVGAVVSLLIFQEGASQTEMPKLHDERLEIALVAEDPDIATPIGLAIDGQDRLFVVESHTHHPPKDYQGPKSDRIKIFADKNGDGSFQDISIFAQGIHQAMNLAFSPTGTLYVVCAREILALPDANGDGICDGIEKILTLDTKQRYAHNSLLGITFDRDGWLYVSRGNTGSDAWAVRGKDGSEISGYGDGGNVFRCRPDGTRIEEVATGFWNPFNLKFAMDGRLLLVDNDPDARGPNRLLHVVQDGDYGYKSLYGGGGNHPFQGWDGSLPGTLPFIAGTGEAPCDLIDCRRTAFPRNYHSSVLATIWNENTIERFDLQPQGDTLTLKKKSVFLSGDKDFRPVALEADSQGNLFFTDWVLVAYPNHGRGRIWRIRPKDGPATAPKGYYDYPAVTRIDVAAPLTDIESASPFIRHAAIGRMSLDDRDTARQSEKAAVRLAALLADRRAGYADALAGYLGDPAPVVRRAALVWAGEHLDPALLPLLDKSLTEPIDRPLFEAYLAAVENLTGTFPKDYRRQKASRANKLERQLDPELLLKMARHSNLSGAIKALALEKLDIEVIERERSWISALLTSDERDLQLAAIRQIAQLTDPDAIDALLALALDSQARPVARCEALLGLSNQPLHSPEHLTELLDDNDLNVAIEAARTLRLHIGEREIREALEERLMEAKGELAEQLAFALYHNDPDKNPFARKRPDTLEGWQQALATGGQAERGRRVFFTTTLMCSRCHSVDGGISLLGPSLDGIAQSVSREQIIHSILRPSDQFPPQYQAWVVRTKDGVTHSGLQLDHKDGGAIELLGLNAETVRFEVDEWEDYEASPASLMPPGLKNLMPVADFRHLAAFLESLK